MPIFQSAASHISTGPRHGEGDIPPGVGSAVVWARLVGVVQQLSMARDMATIMDVVRSAARDLTGADGATFVIADGDHCFYAEENAIEPLWKGCRFPMDACVSGWVIRNRREAVIPDVYADPRVPVEAYRPTFVKSMVMVPIRTPDPIGAIGNYWATPKRPTEEQIAILRALADTAAVAVENVQLYEALESRVRVRTRELELANRELEAFSYTVSHDLRAPLRAIIGFTQAVLAEHATGINAEGRQLLGRVSGAGERMRELIEALLRLSRLSRQPIHRQDVDLGEIARATWRDLHVREHPASMQLEVEEGLEARADPVMMRIVMENLLGNAAKYSAGRPGACVRVSAERSPGAPMVYVVQDNGVGFDMAYADQLFQPFRRLHSQADFPGSGVGLATVRRIIERHAGRIWAEASPGMGACFRFTLDEVPAA